METKETKMFDLEASIKQPKSGTAFTLKLDGVNEDISLNQCIGTVVQRLVDYLRIHKRNNSKLLDCREDVFISVSIVQDGDAVEWISEKAQQQFSFKYRPSASEKGAKRLGRRIYDVVTFGVTKFRITEIEGIK